MSAAEVAGGSGAGPGGSDLALDTAAAAAIVRCHDTAARRIADLASSVPDVDGGYGTADLRAILAKVLGTADQLALINEATALQIREVAAHFEGTDAEVAAGFANLAGWSWPYGTNAAGPTGAGGSDFNPRQTP